MPSSYYIPNQPAWVTPNQPSTPWAIASREDDSVPVYQLFNITGGTGGNGGRSRDGVAGQGGHGEGPTFNNNNYYDFSPEQEKTAVLRELLKAAVPDASYDSAERYTYPLCHPDTRAGYLSSLESWSCKNTSNILWMHGPAGTGKSSIARSFCEELTADDCLGANFFFKRGDPLRESAKGVFPTLAYQLAVHSAKFATAVATVLRKDSSVVSKTLATQFQRLMIEPWNDTAQPGATGTVIVIDGLDECQSEHDQQEILRCILKISLSLKFLVVSRLEPQIAAVLDGAGIENLDVEGSQTDVQKYLIKEFERIRIMHETMHQIHAPWPDRNVVGELAYHSSGHFIYASTVIQFVGNVDEWPVKQLEFIMENLCSAENSVSLFAALDNLYLQILRAVPHSHHSVLLRILWIIAYDTSGFTIRNLAQFLKKEIVEIFLVLRRLHSILEVGPDDLDGIRVRHRSFYDFLDSPTRAKVFAFTADAQSQLALEMLDWCTVLHEPTLKSFDELSK
ncbi:hypothetical protein R3P38DRAFT_3438065 [Favolaschia claudopus]|uniref:Nephrocystin 3-like N-terminal domain-containing protein n=1 Tax=Favolaschia claudopus TaxID=2862362 RepID=A0AAV9ZS91_9AGAR